MEVSLAIDYTPSEEDGIEGAFVYNLLTADDNGLENLQAVTFSAIGIDTDPDATASASLSGLISHFSPLAVQVTTIRGEATFDRFIAKGIPVTIEVGEFFDVNYKFSHPDLSEISADRAIFIEVFDTVVDVAESSRPSFTQLRGEEYFRSYGPIVAGEANTVESTVTYVCKSPGIHDFIVRVEYQDLDARREYQLSEKVNVVKIESRVICVDSDLPAGSMTLEHDISYPDTDPAPWTFTIDPPAATTTVGQSVTFDLSQTSPEFGAETYLVSLYDSNPGIVGNPRGTKGEGTLDLQTILKASRADSRAPDVDILYAILGVGTSSSQTLEYTCEAPGTTRIYFAVEAISMDASRRIYMGTNSTIITITCLADEDGDGVTDPEDACFDNAGTIEFDGCPAGINSEDYIARCEDPDRCDVSASAGSCSDCTLSFPGADTGVACGSESQCATFSEGSQQVLQCQGGCTFTSPGANGTCGSGSTCEVSEVAECVESESGTCSVVLSGGSEVSCPSDDKNCTLVISPGLLDAGATPVTLDLSVVSEGGDSQFLFDYAITADVVTEGGFTITTLGGASTGDARLLFDAAQESLSVLPGANPAFDLQGAACDPLENVVLNDAFDITEVVDSAVCIFSQSVTDTPDTGVFPLPDSATGPVEFSFVPPGAFGLPSDQSYTLWGTDDGAIVFNPDTREVPTVGSQRLSFINDATPAVGALINLNAVNENADVLEAYGQTPLLRQYVPASGVFTTAQIGFDNITQIVPIAGDITNPNVLRVNNTRNSVEVRLADESEPSGWRNRVVIEPENLQDLSSNVVSAFAWETGKPECYHPCQGSGEPMPAVCGELVPAIAQVLASQPGCADFWTPTSCRDAYNSATSGQCELSTSSPEYQVSYGGLVLGVTGGSPSQIFTADPALTFTARATIVGESGNEARRVTCVEGWCGVTHFGSDTLTILQWDGESPASIFTTESIGDGPVGIAMQRVNDTVKILTTGSLNDTYYFTTFSASDGGAMITTGSALPEGCTGAEDIDWKPGSDLAIVSCRSSNSMAIIGPL